MIFGLANCSIKKMILECLLHPSHSICQLSLRKRELREREREREKERELDNNKGMHTENHDNFKLNILTK